MDEARLVGETHRGENCTDLQGKNLTEYRKHFQRYFKVLDKMVRTMGEGVRSSQGQVDDMRRRLERLEILLEASEASVPEMEARAEQRPDTTGPQVEDD